VFLSALAQMRHKVTLFVKRDKIFAKNNLIIRLFLAEIALTATE
jgi:hypothetical protein